jgi:LPS-assembly lipoprotein
MAALVAAIHNPRLDGRVWMAGPACFARQTIIARRSRAGPAMTVLGVEQELRASAAPRDSIPSSSNAIALPLWGRIAALLLAALALAGCGFHPLYGTLDDGTGSGARAVFSSVYVEPIAQEISGYELRNTLIELLHASDRIEGMRYKLTITLNERREGVAVAADANATLTRYGYTMEAHYVLTDLHSNAEITKGTEISQTGYDVASSPYATDVTLQDTRKRAAQDVAERLRLDLGVFFAKRK